MKINQYNQMMSYLSDSLNPALLRSQVATLEQREGFAIGGGAIVGKDLDTREGFDKPKKVKNPNPIEAQQTNIKKGVQIRERIKKGIIKQIDDFEEKKLFPGEKYKINLRGLKRDLKADTSTIKDVVENYLPKEYLDKSVILKSGQSGETGLTLAEKQFFANNYQKRTISQMATDLTGKSYENKITKAKNQQLYRHYLKLKEEGLVEEGLRGAKPKGSVEFDKKSGEAYRKAQQQLMDLDPNVYADLTPSQLDNALKKAVRLSGESAKGTVLGAIDRNAVPKSLLPSFEHFQGVTPGIITQDPDALRKVGITTKDFNFKVLGARAKNNIYKTIKNELRTARESIKLNDKKTAKKSIETVNEIYDAVAKNLGTIDRGILPKYSLSKNTIKEINIKPIKLGKQQNKIEDAIEQYVRFVAGGPKKDVKKIKQPNLKKAVELVKKQDDKALKELIESRVPDIRQGEFFSNPFFSPAVLKPVGAVAKPVLKTIGSVPVSAGLAGMELSKDDPNYSIAGLDLLLPELGKRVPGSGSGILAKAGRFALNPIGRLARGFTPAGIALQGVELVNQGLKEQRRIQDMRENNPEAYQEFLAEQEDMLRQSAAYGGRIGFADGPEDPDKRKFMKIMGGLASLPLVGRFFDLAQIAAPVAEKAVTTAQNVPSYFFKLINKIKKFGKDETEIFSSQPREQVTTYRTSDADYELYEDLNTGSVQIKIRKGDPDGSSGYKEQELTLTKNQPDERTGVVSSDYDEYTVRPDTDGKMKDIDEGLEDIDDLIEELGPENISVKELEDMGYDVNRLGPTIKKKLGIK